MLGVGSFEEILATLRKNKLRTLLTGFSIAWGIFMLIVLLGMGNGLQNGVTASFASEGVTDNYVYLNVWRTSRPYDGMPTGRRITFDDRTLEYLKKNFPEIDIMGPVSTQYVTISHDNEFLQVNVSGLDEDLTRLSRVAITEGRSINELDNLMQRKVIVLHPKTRDVLFKGQDAIGKYVSVNGIAFQVVGIYSDSDDFESFTTQQYIPLETSAALYNKSGTYYSLEFSTKGLETLEEQSAFTGRVRNGLAKLLRFDPEDRQALYIRNQAEDMMETRKVFGILNIFLGIVGLASLIAGIVGVGNIMYVTVKERTREIGIRKAIGASPLSVVKLVIFEAIFITTVSGYVGVLLGAGTLKIIDMMIQSSGGGAAEMFVDPSASPGIVLAATVILIVSGVIAGFVPARKAASISPIEAMRAE